MMDINWISVKDKLPNIKEFIGWTPQGWQKFVKPEDKEHLQSIIKVYKISHWFVPKSPEE